MERIQRRTYGGLSRDGLRLWGFLFLALGIAGKAVFQNRYLGMIHGDGNALLALLEQHPDRMVYATIAVVLQAMETCAVPIFAFLLSEGMMHTENPGKYLCRLLAAAAAAELPFNLAMGGKLLDLGSRNPVFGLVFAAAAIWFCKYYGEKNLKHFLTRILVTVCAALWCGMLKVQYGAITVFIALVLWAFRLKPSYRNIAGATATIVCSLSSMFFMAAPMGFLAVFLYNGEEGEMRPLIKYGAYPGMLLMAAAAAMFL